MPDAHPNLDARLEELFAEETRTQGTEHARTARRALSRLKPVDSLTRNRSPCSHASRWRQRPCHHRSERTTGPIEGPSRPNSESPSPEPGRTGFDRWRVQRTLAALRRPGLHDRDQRNNEAKPRYPGRPRRRRVARTVNRRAGDSSRSSRERNDERDPHRTAVEASGGRASACKTILKTSSKPLTLTSRAGHRMTVRADCDGIGWGHRRGPFLGPSGSVSGERCRRVHCSCRGRRAGPGVRGRPERPDRARTYRPDDRRRNALVPGARGRSRWPSKPR